MIALFNQYATVIKMVAIVGAIIGVLWLYNARLADEYKAGYDKAQAEYAVKLADAKAAALTTERNMQTKLDKAIGERDVYEQTIRVISADAAQSANSLRDALRTIRNSVSTDTVEALRHRTATLATLLDECQERYRQMAEKADRHANDARTCYAAWPVTKAPTQQ